MNTLEQTILNFTIPSDRLNELHARVATLNRKGEKYNISPITCELGTEIVTKVNDETFLMTPVTIKFEPIVIAGDWQFVASVEHEVVDGKHKNLVSGYNLLKEDEIHYRECPSECQHCFTKRQRNLTYIVKSAAGELRQIGSSCLRDYLGVSVEAAVMSLRILSEVSSFGDEEEGFGSGKSCQMDSLKDVVAMTIAVISKHGWMSKAKAEFNLGSSTTNSLVFSYMHHSPFNKNLERLYPTTEQTELANTIISRWDSSLRYKFDNANDDLDTFQYKVAFSVALGYVKPKLQAIIVAATNREIKIVQEEQSPKKEKNEFIPNCVYKDKITLDLTLCKITKFQGDYGTISIMSFKDEDGRKVVWFASAEINENEWVVGHTFKIKATIKDFKDDNRFGKQTIITRATRI